MAGSQAISEGKKRGWGMGGRGTRTRKEWCTKGGHSHLEHNVIRKHVFDTVHHVLCFRLSEFSGFRRGTEQSTQFGKLANASKLLWWQNETKKLREKRQYLHPLIEETALITYSPALLWLIFLFLLILKAASPIIPSAPKCSSRHFISHRKCVCFE